MPIHWRSVDPLLLEPTFRKDVEKFLQESPYDWYVTEGFRSIARSNKLYDEYKNGVILGYKTDGTPIRGKRGPKAAPGGKSAHNYGLAIDVALDGDEIKPGLQMDWNVKAQGWLWLKTESILHPRLKNGWSFHDWPHIERYKWQRYK